MINASVEDWTQKPVVTSIDTTAAPTKDIFFPAVTVCHEMPHLHESWELPTLIFNFFDFVNCGEDCTSKPVMEMLTAFRNFTGKLVDKHLNAKYPEDPQKVFYDTTPGGERLPGIFRLPDGYHGIYTSVGIFFDVLYCDLAVVLEEKIENNPGYLNRLIKRWKSSFITLEPFNVDTLVEEFGVEIDNESFRLWDNLFWGLFNLQCKIRKFCFS